MRRQAAMWVLVGGCLLAGAGLAEAKSPKPARKRDPMEQARAVCDSLAGAARGREGVTVSMREDRIPFCNMDRLAAGWTLLVEVADDASPHGVAAARDLEAWLRARGWRFEDACFQEGPPARRAAFTRGALGCAFDTTPLERAKPVAEGQYAPGYLLTLGVVVIDNPPR